MRFIDFVLKNILRRRIRSLLTISGVSLAVMAIVSLMGVASSLEYSLLSMFRERGVDLVVLRAGGLQRINSVLEAKLGERISRLPGVQRVSAGLVEVFSFEEMDLFGVLTRGVPADHFMLDDLKLIAGRRLVEEDDRALLLGTVLAANLEKQVGDRFEVLPGESFQVVGIYESFNIFENGCMVMPLSTLQRLMGREGEVTAFAVLARDSDATSLEELRSRIKDIGPYLEALPTREYVDTTVELRMARAVAWLTSIQALLIGTIAMVNTMLAAVFERTRELTVLRAIGWSKRRVVKLILGESLILTLSGAVIGTLMAVALMQALSRFTSSGRLVSGEISWEGVAHGLAVALVLGVIGGGYPAYRAACLVPTEGLRHE